MDNLKYFPLYFNRFMDGVRGYDAEFVGIYIMLLCRQAETHRIPKLSRWMGGISSAKIENVLAQKFLIDEHGFFNVVMDQVLEEVAKKSQSARKSVTVRWEKIRSQYERNTNVSETYAKSDTNGILIKESKVKEKKIVFAQFWDLYDKKVDKNKCEGYWQKLTDEEIELIFQHIPLYKLSQPEKQFRKDPKTYLYNKSWNDEIINRDEPKPQTQPITRKLITYDPNNAD
jgi:hypothetical protein